MRPKDNELYARLDKGIETFESEVRALSGIGAPDRRRAFLEQLLESKHRIDFPKVVGSRPISPDRTIPSSEIFDPIRAAIHHKRAGNVDEACWLVFLFIHFGRHNKHGWAYIRAVYGRLGSTPWTWTAVSKAIERFRKWLSDNELRIKAQGGGFGNHRKYESLSGTSEAGTGAVVASYVSWVKNAGGHALLISEATKRGNNDPHAGFEYLFESMDRVHRFGRTARFDYLTMLGKLEIASITPGRTFLAGATGPLRGARLLFGDPSVSSATAEKWLIQLDAYLRVGPQALEDSICNWQKSPNKFHAFRG